MYFSDNCSGLAVSMIQNLYQGSECISRAVRSELTDFPVGHSTDSSIALVMYFEIDSE